MPTAKPSTLITLAGTAALFSAAASCGDSSVTASGGGGSAPTTDGGGGSTGALFGGGGSTANLVSGPGSGGFGGSPPPFVCDPPAEPGSLYENEAISYDISQPDPVSMCQFRGDVLLVFNSAAI